MNAKELKTLVDDAIALHREIASKTEELKSLKATLVLQAQAHPEELVGTESGGKRWTAKGTVGSIARVNFPAPALLSEIEAQSDTAKQAQSIAGENFRHLFSPVKIYQLVDDFRAQARALLTGRKAEALMELCETENSPWTRPALLCPLFWDKLTPRELRDGEAEHGGGHRLSRSACDTRTASARRCAASAMLAAGRNRHSPPSSRSPVAISIAAASRRSRRDWFSLDDRTLIYLAEVLKVEVQELFPKREGANRIHEFLERLEKTRF